MDFRCAFKLLRPRCNQNSRKIWFIDMDIAKDIYSAISRPYPSPDDCKVKVTNLELLCLSFTLTLIIKSRSSWFSYWFICLPYRDYIFYNNGSERNHTIPGELFCPSTGLFVEARHKYVNTCTSSWFGHGIMQNITWQPEHNKSYSLNLCQSKKKSAHKPAHFISPQTCTLYQPTNLHTLSAHKPVHC